MILFFRVTVFSGSCLANMACRTWPERRREGSPDSEIALAENSNRLADFEICQLFQWISESYAPASLSLRYSVGVTPVVALKARLKGPSDWKPASIAMVMTGTSACDGSASAALASSIR